MDQTKSELELAWEEVTFWRDFAVWSKVEDSNSSNHRIQEALKTAELRYAKATQSRQTSTTVNYQ